MGVVMVNLCVCGWVGQVGFETRALFDETFSSHRNLIINVR